jgi:hypothetical protein
VRRILAATLAAAAAAALLPAVSAGEPSRAACGSGAHGAPGYAYAGHLADREAHGVSATISALSAPSVLAGHVAGWVGVGGPGAGPRGEDQWLQVGLAAWPQSPLILYVEVTHPGARPKLIPLETGVQLGQPRRVAVLELGRRPGWWRVWVEGRPVTAPIHLPGSSGRWRPIATAESWNEERGTCNAFAFRFEQVSVARAPGGSWRPFAPGYRFLDHGFSLRQLSPQPGAGSGGTRLLSGVPPDPYAFLAASRPPAPEPPRAVAREPLQPSPDPAA